MPKRTLTALLVAGVLALSGAGAAHAVVDEPTLTANPTTIEVGGSSAITATGLGGLEDAFFAAEGVDGATGGSVSPEDAPVTDGSAQTTFTSTAPGVFTVVVSDGETPLATVQVTVVQPEEPTLTADPFETYVGGSSTVTASGLGDLQTAFFAVEGVDGATGGSVSPEAAPVTDGVAVATFTSTAPGTFTVAVSDGETVLATLEITVVDDVPALSASPTTIAVGATSTVTATGLGAGDEVFFGAEGQNGATGGSVSPDTVTVAADGTAVTTFRSTAPGTFVVVVSDGETPLATVTITVAASAPVSPAPVLPATGGEASPVVLWAGVFALAAGVVVLSVVAARRRSVHRS